MKAFHAADLHYSPGNLVEADRCFGYAVEEAIKQQVQVAIIAGDSTDHRHDAHSPAFLALAKRIKQLADHCPVFMLQGTFSHEPAGMLHVLGLIGAKHPIHVSDRVEMVALANGRWVEYEADSSQKVDLVITSVPTLNKADLALTVGAERVGEAMGEHIAALLQSFAGRNDKLRSLGIPTVLVSHGTVDGAMTEHGVPMAGMDHEFTAGALFSAHTTAVMLGHIHKHQFWKKEHEGLSQRIAYPGSIGRFHYGELGEKFCLVWEIEASDATFSTVATPSRKMIDIVFDGVPDMKEIASVASQCEGAYVRVSFAVDEEFASTIDRQGIRELLHLAAELKIEGRVLPIQRQRCAGISALPGLEQRFLKWAEHAETPKDGLVERLQGLQTMSAIDIVTAFRGTRGGQSTSSSANQREPSNEIQVASH